MLHGIITMDEAHASGMSRSRIYRMVRSGTWFQFHRGIYLPSRPLEKGTPQPNLPTMLGRRDTNGIEAATDHG